MKTLTVEARIERLAAANRPGRRDAALANLRGAYAQYLGRASSWPRTPRFPGAPAWYPAALARVA